MREALDSYEAPALTELGTIEDRTRALAEISIIVDLEP